MYLNCENVYKLEKLIFSNIFAYSILIFLGSLGVIICIIILSNHFIYIIY